MQVKEIFELLLSAIKNAQETQFVSREDFAEKIEQFTTTPNTDGLDLGNYSCFCFKARKVIKLFYKKEQTCENTQVAIDIIEKIYSTASKAEEFRKFTVGLAKG